MKRYELETRWSGAEKAREMAESPDGDWVRFDDVARDGVLTEALKANVMMEAEVERLRAALREIGFGISEGSRTCRLVSAALAPEPKPEAP